MPSEFSERVYAALRKVPRGKVTTYRDLGAAVGCASPRAIGQAMRCNPYAPRVPCHRVVASDGTIGGFRGACSGGEIAEKERMLKREGLAIEGHKIVDFSERKMKW